jgi:hypothetical protein
MIGLSFKTGTDDLREYVLDGAPKRAAFSTTRGVGCDTQDPGTAPMIVTHKTFCRFCHAVCGLEIDLDHTSYYVDHVTILPTGRARMAGWRKRLFALLHQNSIPVARWYRIPPDRVFEVGAYVEL